MRRAPPTLGTATATARANRKAPVESALLRQFITVAGRWGLGSAPAGDPRTQPDATTAKGQAALRTLNELEKKIGLTLFDRRDTSIELTEVGAALLAKAKLDAEVIALPANTVSSAPAGGGKAKANKGKGRAPAVKGAQPTGKRRQSR